MYFLLLVLLYPLSLLPLKVLYVLSDAVYGVLYYLIGYRKEIVWSNLKHAFPEKSDEELKLIRKKFYHNFCDQWIETLKLLSISKAALNRRFTGNWDVFQNLAKEGKNTYAILGHTFNWEWANAACPFNTPQPYNCVYLPLSSKAVDRFMLTIRSRTGAKMISMKALKSGFSKLKDSQYILALAADQNPAQIETAAWLSFMNREAPFFRGPEHMARRAKAAVVFAGIKKIRRGYYQINLSKFCDDASQVELGNVLQAYVSFVETQLHQQPDNWLWTHKRWKHSRLQ
ncbi:MAG: lysophospholipid acyltransferase family protein [Bacteroidetes bacterium]|nr:lysophospholipid acyltransferase family protein [Bacteroidota bacterium]MBS1739232.1 lysophospholipid acyltransferase family protein [Bacteroidota bacterium]